MFSAADETLALILLEIGQRSDVLRQNLFLFALTLLCSETNSLQVGLDQS